MRNVKNQRNIKMVIAYEGTRYAGFQRQKAPIVTIQGTLEQAIFSLTGESVSLTGAGRTDAGVHARGQVVNFYTSSKLSLERIQLALNCILPADIVIRDLMEMNHDFHARYDAQNKTYSYTISNSKIKPLFNRDFVYHYQYFLDIELMQKALAFLEGTHDFCSFQASGSAIVNTVRTINYIKLSQTGSDIILNINANGFLYHMVRNIVGTLITIGNSKISLSMLRKIIEEKDRKQAGPTAPACGLCLEEINY